ncbi:citramalate synthase [Metallosphaera hakonensis]|uniref:Citramalate synthase n=1 Tax=Metallosphaera hakonensis JCM 8857 = DSM 7519 TaxID=1293036 RepID=A0A2U9IUI5_9CREN|nr:citramalate synthase [Metallosphaera hakonensis]AWR99642.1 citramalate synthase [Metallosphaera hakonensis JCM 8857 = DSM 7519]
MAKKSIEILDTTLRDGAQAASVSFTLRDKVKVALLLDGLGVDYIEGGWPGSNPKDYEFFREIKNYHLKNSKIAAFGSTRRKDVKPDKDSSLSSILEADVEVAVLFGKTWTLHVKEILRTTLEDNLAIIADSIQFLRDHGLEVIFDAEHFYQGFKEDPEYALQVVKVAGDAGARVVTLADTNGGTLPHEILEITKYVHERSKVKLGVHMHNDSGTAVANSLMGVVGGARHVQGTINGIGERTGNADLVQIIPSLALKMGYNVLKESDGLRKLRNVSASVYELSGLHPNPFQPYVGDNAFTHKAGVHADAVMKNTRAYEHIDPSLIGNARKVVISELAGTSNLVNYLERIGLKVEKKEEKLKHALKLIKELESRGYSFDLAPESALLIVLRELGIYEKFIDLKYWKVINENGLALAVVKVNSRVEAAEGSGPVHAVDIALRRCLIKDFPELERVKLTDYRVILPGVIKNTESVVRVTIEFNDGEKNWRTEGVSTSVIEASIMALVDGLDYYLQVNKKLKPLIAND